MKLDFRSTRKKLSASAFAIPGVEIPPTDLINRRVWYQIIHLPDDVALMTTDHYGTLIASLGKAINKWSTIGLAVMDFDDINPFDYFSIDAHDEFDASLFNAIHGYYRSGFSALRNVIEYLSFGLTMHLKNDLGEFEKWKSKQTEVRFNESANSLISLIPDRAISRKLFWQGAEKIYKGCVRYLYKDLCKYVHGSCGATDGDMRKSNGPIFVKEAFEFWVILFIQTIIVSYLLFAIAYQGKEIDSIKEILGDLLPYVEQGSYVKELIFVCDGLNLL